MTLSFSVWISFSLGSVFNDEMGCNFNEAYSRKVKLDAFIGSTCNL